VRPLNELQIDDAWQREVFDRLLAPVLREATYQGQIIFLDIATSVASLLQRRAHVDAVAQLPKGGTMSLEFKIVRWPGARQGHFVVPDGFIDTLQRAIYRAAVLREEE
jgi:hypothetical protein